MQKERRNYSVFIVFCLIVVLCIIAQKYEDSHTYGYGPVVKGAIPVVNNTVKNAIIDSNHDVDVKEVNSNPINWEYIEKTYGLNAEKLRAINETKRFFDKSSYSDTLKLRIVSLIIKESGFDPYAVSPNKKGYGLLQINPIHFKTYGLNEKSVFDINENLTCGITIYFVHIDRAPNRKTALANWFGHKEMTERAKAKILVYEKIKSKIQKEG